MEGLGGRGRAHALEGGASCHDIYSVLHMPLYMRRMQLITGLLNSL